jgi:copper resistance protein C
MALAHTELETATPEAGSTVPSPFDGPILLTFSEELAGGSKAELLDPGGDVVATATVDGPAAVMVFELEAPLEPGDHVIEWTGVAVDGHVERDTFAFTVAPAPTPEPTPSPTPAPSASATQATPSAEPAASATASPSPTPTDTVDPSGEGDVVLPIVVGLLVVAVGGAYLLTRRGRPAA